MEGPEPDYLRMECLRLAMQGIAANSEPPKTTLERAQAYEAWVMNRDTNQAPVE